MPIGSSLTDRYFVPSYVRTIVRLLHKNTFSLAYGLQDATVLSRWDGVAVSVPSKVQHTLLFSSIVLPVRQPLAFRPFASRLSAYPSLPLSIASGSYPDTALPSSMSIVRHIMPFFFRLSPFRPFASRLPPFGLSFPSFVHCVRIVSGHGSAVLHVYCPACYAVFHSPLAFSPFAFLRKSCIFIIFSLSLAYVAKKLYLCTAKGQLAPEMYNP